MSFDIYGFTGREGKGTTAVVQNYTGSAVGRALLKKVEGVKVMREGLAIKGFCSLFFLSLFKCTTF